MLSIGSFAFAAPWALVALLSLPAIWWLLRLTPPVPKRVVFPPIRLLFGLVTERETSATTPWWLLVLRLLIAALIIFAASRPLLNAEQNIGGSGPMLLVVDNGWAAAEQWEARRTMALSLVDRAVRAGRSVALLATAPPSEGSAITVRAPGPAEARAEIAKLIPVPWPADRGQSVEAVINWAGSLSGPADIRWLSDGLDSAGAETLAERLSGLGRVTLYGAGDIPMMLIRPPSVTANGLEVRLERPYSSAQAELVTLRGSDAEGQVLAETSVEVSAGATAADAVINAPAEILNRIERVEIAGQAHTGAVALLDQRWRRRPAGIVDVDGTSSVQPLLSNTYYLERALAGSTTVRKSSLAALFDQPMSLLVLPDGLELSPEETDRVRAWVNDGGIFIRFAGPALARRSGEAQAGAAAEPLLPVPLRAGDRIIGGAMSWRQPMGLAPFSEDSPFDGLTPPRDVRVTRQVLAQPTPDLASKTWASLTDGTPLVTAERRERGWVVLFHTAATPSWSNLPLSGVFVEMMQRLTALGQGVQGAGYTPPLPPESIMDAFARLGPPAANVQPIDASAVDTDVVSERHPPGIYGGEDLRRALNLTAALPEQVPLPVPPGATRAAYDAPKEQDLTAWLFLAAFLLFLVDMAAGLWIRTGGRVGHAGAAAAVALVLLTGAAPSAMANDKYAMENSLDTRLAFLKTGNSSVDEVSELGLQGLTLILARRTAAELGPPQPVEPGRDELAFFPLIYWPVTPDYEIDDVAALAIKEYLHNGGSILFDTQDRGGGAQAAALRHVANKLDLPQLVPVGEDHVLTRAFYLLDDFPGLYAGAPIWVERAGERVNDGVSPVVAGSADWASAWALDATQKPIFPVVPGGERQREMAFRFGVNLVMYVLTGNYKGDQVHLPAILNRLGQ